jgi:hypothetical protein
MYQFSIITKLSQYFQNKGDSRQQFKKVLTNSGVHLSCQATSIYGYFRMIPISSDSVVRNVLDQRLAVVRDEEISLS